MARLFGTDGVRGVVNEDLTPELVFRLGRAGAAVLARNGMSGSIFVGRDTRRSGLGLEGALIAGLTSTGADVVRLGVMTTPGLAYLVRTERAAAGVVISASHNPMEYNGIKFFSQEGYKLPDELEDEIAAHLEQVDQLPRPTGKQFGAVYDREEVAEKYVEYLVRLHPHNLTGMHVALDCAHGAATAIAPSVFERLGCRVSVINNEPDGMNINEGSGALYPESLADYVVQIGADVGFAFDGDADRLIAIDEQGRIVDGDAIMAIAGLHALRHNNLPGSTVVGTVMSNIGLERALAREGGKLLRTKVGDRYVLEAMLQHGYTLGGEQSGHIILLDKNTTGDGVLTALECLRIMQDTGKRLSELAKQMVRYPQVLHNVSFDGTVNRDQLLASEEVQAAIRAIEEKLGNSGRILVRPSGTEPLIRIMLEGDDEQELDRMGLELGDLLSRAAKRGGSL